MPCLVSPQRIYPLSNADDDVLIRQLEAGQKAAEGQAFQVIYQRYVRLVYDIALRILHSAEDAEDITQEIFLGLHYHCRDNHCRDNHCRDNHCRDNRCRDNRCRDNRCGYDAGRGSLKNFLAMQARSRALDKLRSHKNQHKILNRLRLSATRHTASPPIEHVIRAQIAHRLRSALLKLPLTQREVLENAYYKGLSQTEISHQLSVPLGTVKSRSRQGLKKLRCALAEEN